VNASLAAAQELPVAIATAPGPLAGDALRVNHTGRRAALTTVWSALAALARGLGSLGHDADLATALAVATDTWYATIGKGRR
jgi:aspartate aminotransferase-like enzyme